MATVMATCFGRGAPGRGVRQTQFTVLNMIMRNVRKHPVCNRNYYKKVKSKKQNIPRDKIDIDGILRSSRASSAANELVLKNTSTKNSSQDKGVQMWQGSEERTTLLRKSEKRWAMDFTHVCL